MKTIWDTKYRFAATFTQDTGFYYRTNTYNTEGKPTRKDAFMASFPHLLDIGIMGHCLHGLSGRCLQTGVQCYQDGLNKTDPNMTLANFERIAAECEGKIFQFALGGRGDPEMHEDFEGILQSCRKHGIIPNMTTSGFGLTDAKIKLIKRFCGAAAVSWYRTPYTLSAINRLLDAGIITNIHYVISNNTLEEAIDLLERGAFPQGVKKIIFLLHKPVGLGSENNILRISDARVRRFFKLFDNSKICEISGFDSCCVPGIMNMTAKIYSSSLDSCESARYSAYITPDMKMLPCSFDQQHHWAYDISDSTIEDGWNSPVFENFRDILQQSCPDCALHNWCLGGCPINKKIVLCGTINGGIPNEIQN
jgi:radical SAM protein with 4Fe4S-binding SPASM domain